MFPKCDKPLQRGGFCQLKDEHKGRHSRIVFTCDGCGRTIRGYPHKTQNIYAFGEIDDVFEFCFLCELHQRE